MESLVLTRLRHDEHATLGRLYIEGADGERRLLCWTLENRPPRVAGVKEPKKSRIPAGTHRLGLRGEGRFYGDYTAEWPWHEEMVEILLDGWKWVLFHVGNFHRDTDGCVLVGSAHGRDNNTDGALAVWHSRACYKAVYPDLLRIARAGGSITIEDEAA